MKRYDINSSSTIFEGKIYDRMMDGNLTPWAREMMVAKIMSVMPDKKAFRPYTMAKMLDIHGKTAARLIPVARKKWYEKNWWRIELEKERLRREMEKVSRNVFLKHPEECGCAEKIAKYQKEIYERESKKVWEVSRRRTEPSSVRYPQTHNPKSFRRML